MEWFRIACKQNKQVELQTANAQKSNILLQKSPGKNKEINSLNKTSAWRGFPLSPNRLWSGFHAIFQQVFGASSFVRQGSEWVSPWADISAPGSVKDGAACAILHQHLPSASYCPDCFLWPGAGKAISVFSRSIFPWLWDCHRKGGELTV